MFQTAQHQSVARRPWSNTNGVSDFNGNGKADIAIINFRGQITLELMF